MVTTDNSGDEITADIIEGLKRFNCNDVPMKLCHSPSSVLTFEIDEEYQKKHEEEAAIYWQILPSQMRDIAIPFYQINDILTFSMQYQGQFVDASSIIKDFRVTHVKQIIEQDVTHLCIFVTVSVVPVDHMQEEVISKTELRDIFTGYCKQYEANNTQAQTSPVDAIRWNTARNAVLAIAEDVGIYIGGEEDNVERAAITNPIERIIDIAETALSACDEWCGDKDLDFDRKNILHEGLEDIINYCKGKKRPWEDQ